MPNLTFIARPSNGARSIVLAGLPFVLALGLVGSPYAQTGPRPEKPRGHHAMRLMGPVTPEILRDSIGLTGAKLDQYTRQYRSHMASTKPARDSLQAALRTMREAHERGDTAARGRRQALRQQAESLIKRDREFEAGLKNILSQDQQKRYAQWKEQRIKLAREQHRHGRREHGGWKPESGRDSTATFSDSTRS